MDPDWSELATPTLIRAARGVYLRAVRVELAAIGVEDLPRNGAVVLAGIEATGGLRRELTGQLGVTKQAVSQVVDVLVGRGYLRRATDPADRRRVALEVTGRGREVLDAVQRGTEAVDAELGQRVGADTVTALRAGLAALAEIKVSGGAPGDDAAGRRRSPRQLRRFCPIFPVRDLAAALAHYASLGFATVAYAHGDEYGFADRDGTGLHLAADAAHDPATGTASAYLYVGDADALYAEWTRPGIGGTTRPVHPTPYELREGSHVDPDGNLIRFGSSAR